MMTTKAINKLSERERRYLQLLLDEREKYEAQRGFHADEALNSDNDTAGQRSCFTNHMADCSTDSFQHEIELSMMSAEGDRIEQVDEAIERLESGEFGYCHDCGKDINPARLEVIPHTRLCVHCQGVREVNNGKNIEFFTYDASGNEEYRSA